MAISVPRQAVLHRWVLWLIANRLVKQLDIKEYTIAGSYRRGKWWCNDIDLVVPVESDSQKEGICLRLRQLGWKPTPFRINNEELFSRQFIKRIAGKYVVLDMFLAPPGTLGNALLFATGSTEFNNRIRASLATKGFTWHNPRYFTNIETGQQVSFISERVTMDFLGIKWINPKNRI